MTRATPRPWIKRERSDDFVEITPTDNQLLKIATVSGCTMAEARANAALIVRAVNSYDAMREALVTLDAFLTDLETSNPGYLRHLSLQDYAQFNDAMMARKAALALAVKP